MLKRFTVSSLANKRNDLSEANELNGQAKYRLKVAVKEVTNAQAEIDKYTRRSKKIKRRKPQK